ncbi:hypothetical protein HYH03_009652 [Edaphochlamys debaryana]|uniref:Uncharacterized protein n=1 Tax=Edaphochlamys debaryana TaxID=47281 RepID=A0A836BWY4_9CHLO|nr:hypothetical protein HYH03_009652 [Edaphochlamys debaryana]|eukprot:KAG2492161.1 hypothetical protein HYH03_009652 [Edaphochlamys debaryana]
MLTSQDGDGLSPGMLSGARATTLQPGQLSKPEKVWVSSSTIIIGFYQAAPYSETFKIFYKKSGAVFGTQIMLTPASILGPELAVRQPVAGEVQYFEYEIKKLKPSTQYVIKIKTADDSCEVRSDKMGTVSLEEERTRDNDMRNFVGALVKLGDYDGLVLTYSPPTGIFAVRILQLDDIASSLQLARLTSDYTDSGVPVQAYTLSQIRFGRWGGSITGSKVVNEGELKWLVARAVQLGDKSDAAAAFDARQRLLQAQVERVASNLEQEWAGRFRSLRLRAIAYIVLLVLVSACMGCGLWALLSRSGGRQRELLGALEAGAQRQAALEAELSALHMYRVSMELAVQQRTAAHEALLRAGAGDTNGSAAGVANRTGVYGTCGSLYGSSATCGSGFGGVVDLLHAGAPGETGGGGGGGGGGSGGEARSGSDGGGEDAASGRKAKGRAMGGGSTGPGSGTSQKAKKDRDRGPAAAPKAPYRRAYAAAAEAAANGGGASRRRQRRRRDGAGGGGQPVADGPVDAMAGVELLYGLPYEVVQQAMAHSRLALAEAAQGGGADGGGAAALRQPDAWSFIHYASHVYATHLQEWMKVQLRTAVRHKVDEMLAPQPPSAGGTGGTVSDSPDAASAAESGAPDEAGQADRDAAGAAAAGPAGGKAGGKAGSRGASGAGSPTAGGPAGSPSRWGLSRLWRERGAGSKAAGGRLRQEDEEEEEEVEARPKSGRRGRFRAEAYGRNVQVTYDDGYGADYTDPEYDTEYDY